MRPHSDLSTEPSSTASPLRRRLSAVPWRRWLIFAALFGVLYAVGGLIPEGFDWREYYSVGRLHPIWTPWTYWILKIIVPLGYPFVFALSVIGIGARAYRYRPSPWPLALALLSLPTLWVFFMGNLDGLVLFGMLLLPWGAPLVLMKPQVSAFALLARRRDFLAAAAWGLLSLLIWGPWPLNLLMVGTPAWKAEWVQDISLFPWGLLGLPLLWFSRGDEDLLMAAGSLFTPHLFPYHFILLMPALARMRWPWAVLTFLASWTPVIAANTLGGVGWRAGNLLSLCFWFGIYLSAPRRALPGLATLRDGSRSWVQRVSKLLFAE